MKRKIWGLFSSSGDQQEQPFVQVNDHRSIRSCACRLRQAMSRRIKKAWASWLSWSVPSRQKWRSAVNWASMRLSQLA